MGDSVDVCKWIVRTWIPHLCIEKYLLDRLPVSMTNYWVKNFSTTLKVKVGKVELLDNPEVV